MKSEISFFLCSVSDLEFPTATIRILGLTIRSNHTRSSIERKARDLSPRTDHNARFNG